jgi:ABC-2 type transport system permease protein
MNRKLRARRPTALVLQATAFVRKELVEILRQPRLLLTLIIGPFVLLVAFGNSYRQEGVRLRTVFVGPPGGVYEHAVEQYRDTLEQYVRVVGYTADQKSAEDDIVNGRADLAVIFPADAFEQLREGKQASVLVLNDKLDPVQTAAVDIAARLAVQEVNASILASVVQQVQSTVEPVAGVLQRSLDASGALNEAAARSDQEGVRQAASEVGTHAAALRQSALFIDNILANLAPNDDTQQQRAQLQKVDLALADVNSLADELTATADNIPLVTQRAAAITQRLNDVRPEIEQLRQVDAAVLTRPFTAATKTVLPQPIGVTAFFAPSSIALLLQHFALSLAALTLVRDRSLGLVEILRVGPTSAAAVIVGRFIAFCLGGVAVAAALFLAVTEYLDVPNFGSAIWMWLTVALLLLASVALGMVVALLSRTDSEVVQYAMLVLLASLFFGGFVLDLKLFNTWGEVISWLLPVTYAIKVLQQTMLRGREPEIGDLVRQGVQIVVYGSVALFLFRRRLRLS